LSFFFYRCVASKNGPQIPKQDIEKIIVLAEEKFESSKEKILNNPTVQPIRKLLDTAVEFGKCVKDCFMERSNHGACFQKHNCQPYIQANRTRKTIRKCIRQVDWKTAAGELCKCSMDAGVRYHLQKHTQ
uniref:Apple domain-containing protein n=1 Tax=Gongylonema pulchrum TaxID=637853 RepID=A0A183CWI6_9BILA